MYLESIRIKNFRIIEDTEIKFKKGLNILIGPNNSGKTTIIDALRICFTYKDYNSNIRIKKEDFNKKALTHKYEDIEFYLTFKIENSKEGMIFYDLYNPQDETLNIYFSFKYNTERERIYSDVFGGPIHENPISNEVFEYMINIYLSALRDANRYLTPGRHNILSKFFSKLISEKDKEELMGDINSNITDSELSKKINELTEDYIENHFKEMIFENDSFELNTSPIDQDFDTFTKNWKIQFPLEESSYLEITQNGLGYNNLIYISVLLSHLDALKEIEEEQIYVSLCIEEPEAHLHPQLQNSFFSYLNKVNQNTNLQIFITSHSPTLTAKADLDSLIIIQNVKNNVITHNLKNIFTDEENRNYLKKFLDVTKSQLLFAKKAIFVEGISEALLIPTFARIYDFDLDKNGVEIVNVEGLSFKHFIPLFDENNCLNLKGVIFTDDDRKTPNEKNEKRYEKMKELENKKLKVKCSEKTFEVSLIKTNGFDSAIFKVFKNKHPKIFRNVDDNEKLFKKFNEKQSIKKSQIALEISEKLKECNDKSIIPKYIKEGFDFLMEKENDSEMD